ncbi:hypothetical protein F5882DRAFT_446072 [Hyaloscypha sp. PMI_1271]|nr:hypothetical protein F5882DRAFT_446072 [Hyaloscypha sp. PMI_1271]
MVLQTEWEASLRPKDRLSVYRLCQQIFWWFEDMETPFTFFHRFSMKPAIKDLVPWGLKHIWAGEEHRTNENTFNREGFLGSIANLTRSNLPTMPSQLRNRTRVTSAEPTASSAASSATLEQSQNEPTLGRAGTRRPKRGFGGSSDEIACKLHLPRIGNTELISVDTPNTTSDEKPGSQRRKKRRLTEPPPSRAASASAMAVATVRKVPVIACALILWTLFIEGIFFHPHACIQTLEA